MDEHRVARRRQPRPFAVGPTMAQLVSQSARQTLGVQDWPSGQIDDPRDPAHQECPYTASPCQLQCGPRAGPSISVVTVDANWIQGLGRPDPPVDP